MTSDTDRLQPEPAEGDRATIERELKRSEQAKGVDKDGRDPTDNLQPVKDFDTSSSGRRIFNNGDTDRGT